MLLEIFSPGWGIICTKSVLLSFSNSPWYSKLMLDKRFIKICHRNFYCLQFIVYSLQFTVYSLQFTVYSLQFTVYNLQFTIYSLQFTVYSEHPWLEMFVLCWMVVEQIKKLFDFITTPVVYCRSCTLYTKVKLYIQHSHVLYQLQYKSGIICSTSPTLEKYVLFKKNHISLYTRN